MKNSIKEEKKLKLKLKLDKINKARSKVANLSLLLLLIFTFVNLTSVNLAYAIEKPAYTDWIRDLYDYDETVTDEEILKDKVFEDETGRVFYKNPSSLAYEDYDGVAGIIGTLKGFFVGGKINLSDFDITCKKGNCKIVYYNQTDYGNEKYASSTIRASGCGPTALAMVVDSLTNADIGVVDMCRWAAQNGYYVAGQGSKWSLMTEGAKAFGLNVNKISKYNMNNVIKALEASHPVIMICGPGDFTKGGHFIVLTGIDENGNVSINDPASRKKSDRTWPILTIINNASMSGSFTFWEIYR